MSDSNTEPENQSQKNSSAYEDFPYSVKTAKFENDQYYSTLGANCKKSPNFVQENPSYDKTERKNANIGTYSPREEYLLNDTIKKKPNQFFRVQEEEKQDYFSKINMNQKNLNNIQLNPEKEKVLVPHQEKSNFRKQLMSTTRQVVKLDSISADDEKILEMYKKQNESLDAILNTILISKIEKRDSETQIRNNLVNTNPNSKYDKAKNSPTFKKLDFDDSINDSNASPKKQATLSPKKLTFKLDLTDEKGISELVKKKKETVTPKNKDCKYSNHNKHYKNLVPSEKSNRSLESPESVQTDNNNLNFKQKEKSIEKNNLQGNNNIVSENDANIQISAILSSNVEIDEKKDSQMFNNSLGPIIKLPNQLNICMMPSITIEKSPKKHNYTSPKKGSPRKNSGITNDYTFDNTPSGKKKSRFDKAKERTLNYKKKFESHDSIEEKIINKQLTDSKYHTNYSDGSSIEKRHNLHKQIDYYNYGKENENKHNKNPSFKTKNINLVLRVPVNQNPSENDDENLTPNQFDISPNKREYYRNDNHRKSQGKRRIHVEVNHDEPNAKVKLEKLTIRDRVKHIMDKEKK